MQSRRATRIQNPPSSASDCDGPHARKTSGSERAAVAHGAEAVTDRVALDGRIARLLADALVRELRSELENNESPCAGQGDTGSGTGATETRTDEQRTEQHLPRAT